MQRNQDGKYAFYEMVVVVAPPATIARPDVAASRSSSRLTPSSILVRQPFFSLGKA
jgi:hypothetical protein